MKKRSSDLQILKGGGRPIIFHKRCCQLPGAQYGGVFAGESRQSDLVSWRLAPFQSLSALRLVSATVVQLLLQRYFRMLDSEIDRIGLGFGVGSRAKNWLYMDDSTSGKMAPFLVFLLAITFAARVALAQSQFINLPEEKTTLNTSINSIYGVGDAVTSPGPRPRKKKR